MNFLRSRLSIGNFIGPRCTRITETWSHRGMCNKPQEVKSEPPTPAPPAQANHTSFRIPGIKPSNLDKKMLLWSGRFKTLDQIPEFVSFEMVDAARNKVRVKACYVMMVSTIAACLFMVFLGKRGAGQHDSLTSRNMEKKARWREEYQREKQAATEAMSEKTQ